jgi:Fe-S-cluster-containing dehydrogenase component/CRP-like cAMP-binding protein
MPREHKTRREVLDAIKKIDSISELLSTHEGHFNYEIDLEVTVYGRNYGGKKVGPYVKLLTYEPGEVIIKEGDWGGNTFYFVVEGHADVFINAPGGMVKVAEMPPGRQFGEMSVLAGVPRSATVKAPPDAPVQVLEVERPALRLLRKLPRFGEVLDKTYRQHGRNAILDELKFAASLSDDIIDQLKEISLFRVFSKNHVLLRERSPMDRIYIIREGWVRRTSAGAEDFLGRGYCLGLEGVLKNMAWPYTATLMNRAEILEIPIAKLRQSASLREAMRQLERFAPPHFGEQLKQYEPGVRQKILSAQEQLLDTGLMDATNLLVMDMDLCVRCGNCSLACHKVHGHSRLVRRGIHVERLTAPRQSARQSVLAPQVCMHCKDPECLTGCPTGAIGRFSHGEIDINPATCIGCSDCATQCPYNAISMVPRKAAKPSAASGLAAKLKDLFRISLDPLPQPVEQIEDLVAVKCNLCNNTPLNPPGSQRPAYSCEENCPTGALARINPKEYFDEVGKTEGMLFLDQTHAVGRNIHRSDPTKRAFHIAGALLVLISLALTIWGIMSYGLGGKIIGFLNMRWITGLVGLMGIAAVMTYPARRQIYRKRAGPLRYWLQMHSYVGVMAGAIILIHGGTDSGGLLTTSLMISYDLVILTGLIGIFLYYALPRLMTRIEASPLLIDDLRARREELQKEIAEIASRPQLTAPVRQKVIPRFLSIGYLLRQYLKREGLDQLLESARKEFELVASQITDEKERRRFNRAVEAAATLRRVDALILLHRSLRLWLPPHVIFTSLMLALMIVHIIQVVYYAWKG